MKLKTSITILGGCLILFLFILLSVILSIQETKEDIVASYVGSSFELKDVNNDPITEKSFEGPLTAVFFGFTNCPDVCPLTLANIDQVMEKLEDDMDVTHTISSILEYHNYMVARFEEYKDRFNQVEEHFKNAAANGEDLSEKLWLDEVCDVLSGDDVNETSDASDTEIEPIKKKRRCGDDTCEDSTCE